MVDLFVDLNAQIGQFPHWLQYWLTWMQTTLILVPFFFWKYHEARIWILAQLLNFLLGGMVYAAEGLQITKLFGLGHIFWAAAYVYILLRLLKRQIDLTGKPFYRAWLYIALATLTISLPLDAYDLAQYALGTRQPMVEYYTN
ncbi:MAG: hypothetical protein RLN89_14930 [Parvibaculum sp.]